MFKVGDKVEVVKRNSSDRSKYKVGHKGTVTHVEEEYKYFLDYESGYCVWFYGGQLKKQNSSISEVHGIEGWDAKADDLLIKALDDRFELVVTVAPSGTSGAVCVYAKSGCDAFNVYGGNTGQPWLNKFSFGGTKCDKNKAFKDAILWMMTQPKEAQVGDIKKVTVEGKYWEVKLTRKL